MRFVETKLAGVYIVEVEPHEDDRGMFARTFCAREMAEQGLETSFVQCNVSYNERAGTLRGLHWQAEPHPETKLVRCTAGRIFDVIVDLRVQSPTYREWVGVELDDVTRRALYIPGGLAHGFQTLVDGCEVFYQMSEFYRPELARGARYDDPFIGVAWPRTVTAISQRDLSYPLLEEEH